MKKLVFILGVFISYANFAYAEIFSENTANGCSFDYNPATLTALFEPTLYNCSSGYYLPANIDGCTSCLSGHTCSGGNFRFNQNIDQGIVYTLPIVENVEKGCSRDLLYNGNLVAEFVPNTHTCSVGYYLPADVDACTQCPANSYSVGGTYSFNENIDQGISACATGYSAPAGSSVCTANTISITWDHADAADITANNAGNVTYGGDIHTPLKAQHINGKIFTGWTFNAPE